MWCFWTAKGGAGCSVLAATAALLQARSTPTLLVDLDGDATTVLGLPPAPVSLVDWLDTEPNAVPPDALSRIEVRVDDLLSVLAWRSRPGWDRWHHPGRFDPSQAELLARLLAADPRRVVVDIGNRPVPGSGTGNLLGEQILGLASRSTLVTRSCYLGLRSVRSWPRPDSVALVAESGRVLGRSDVEGAVGAPVVSFAWDPAVARAVDAGLARQRLPRSLKAVRLLERDANRHLHGRSAQRLTERAPTEREPADRAPTDPVGGLVPDAAQRASHDRV